MIFGISAVALLIVIAVTLVRFQSPRRSKSHSYASDTAFLNRFSVARYSPLPRLVAGTDREYLQKVHGRRLASTYRKIQRTLVREYIRDLSRDVKRLYSILNMRSAMALTDEGNVSLALTEQQTTFALLIWGIEARLMLDTVMPQPIDVAPLLKALESLTVQTQALARPAQALAYRAS